jgi:membrane associated rhomboid family serine protease
LIPLRDSTPHSRPPAITVSLIVLNAAAFLLQLALPGNAERAFMALGLVPARLVGPDPFAGAGLPSPWVGLFTGIFLHAGFLHLAGNMWFLWLFGDNVEDRMGRGRFLLFYLLCGLLASAAHVALAPSSRIPTIGASGAIAGVMGAYTFLYPRARIRTLVWYFFIIDTIEVPAFVFLGLWFLLQLFGGLGGSAEAGGVAFWAHVGGFVAGIPLMMVFIRRTSRRARPGFAS